MFDFLLYGSSNCIIWSILWSPTKTFYFSCIIIIFWDITNPTSAAARIFNNGIKIQDFTGKIKSYDKKGNIQNGLAFNDVSMIRNSPRIAKIKVQVNNKIRINEFLGDGCLISTPAGSSAYNLSLRGPVIPVGAQVLALTPISPYRPRRWRGALLNNYVKITLHSLDHESRPVRAEADFMEFDDLVKLEIELDKTKFMNLLFDPGHDMEERIITEQFDNWVYMTFINLFSRLIAFKTISKKSN